MSKKKNTKKPSVNVKDLRAKKDPKGGAFDAFLKIDGIKGESMDAKHKGELESSLKIKFNPLDVKLR